VLQWVVVSVVRKTRLPRPPFRRDACFKFGVCVAVYCSVFQRVAVWCSVMQCVAVCCSALPASEFLQCDAVCCDVL